MQAKGERRMKHKVKHVHFVGIGGSGMCGIAEVLATQGITCRVRTLRRAVRHVTWRALALR
jgi:hypothetical protein